MKPDKIVLLALCLSTAPVVIAEHEDTTTRDAAIGGGLGGAAGGEIGAEIGGREGAIIGSAAGAALGTAISTDDSRNRHSGYDRGPNYYPAPGGGHPQYRHCPPGQAKKGRC